MIKYFVQSKRTCGELKTANILNKSIVSMNWTLMPPHPVNMGNMCFINESRTHATTHDAKPVY